MKTTNIVKIDGKPLPPISKLTITHNPIWSKNAGRGSDGEFVGDIVTKKYKLDIEFAPLSDEQAQYLMSVIEKTNFLSVSFKSPRTNLFITVLMYAGTPSFPVYSYVENLPRYNGVALELVEK